MKILVADDDWISRTLAVKLLEKMSYDVIACDNGRQALDLLLSADAPRLAILDWMMPEMDGPDVIRAVRKQSESYPYIVLLTNRTEILDKVEGLEAGADDYLVKPVNAVELQARVQVGVRFLDLQDRLDRNSKSLIRLEREQKNASLAKMAGGVAHLLNNKLQAVIGFLDLLRVEFNDQQLLGPSQADLLNRARFAALESADIGKKMLSYLSQNPGKPERVDVRRLCRSAISDLQEEFPVLRDWDSGEAPPHETLETLANPEELQQVIYQVLRNALEANPKDAPRVRLDMRDGFTLLQPAFSGPHISTFHPKNSDQLYIRVTIEDGGPGIPPENMGQIFDPFFTTKFTGRGLGLPVAMGILKKLGGGIRIASRPEGGTRADLFFPALR